METEVLNSMRVLPKWWILIDFKHCPRLFKFIDLLKFQTFAHFSVKVFGEAIFSCYLCSKHLLPKEIMCSLTDCRDNRRFNVAVHRSKRLLAMMGFFYILRGYSFSTYARRGRKVKQKHTSCAKSRRGDGHI